MPFDRKPLFPVDDEPARFRVYVCRGPHCSARGSAATLQCFEEQVREAGLDFEVEIIATSCRDRCDFGPSVNVFPGPTLYAQVGCDAAARIVAEHLHDDQPVRDLFFDTRFPGRSR